MNEKEKKYTVPAERQEQILQYIKTRGSWQIKNLAEWVGVSEATVRRDLDELDRMGKLERTHGGAILSSFGTSFERQHEEKLSLMQDEKQRIALKAASYIHEGDAVFIDSGTTVYYLKNALRDIPNLTVFTYDLIIANTLELHSTSTLIVTGGVRRQGYNYSLVGSQVVDFLRNIRVDKVLLAADAVDLDFGVSNSNFIEAEVKSLLTSIGKELFLLVDHTKFDTVAMAKVCSLRAIDVLITDSGASEAYLDKLRKRISHVDVV